MRKALATLQRLLDDRCQRTANGGTFSKMTQGRRDQMRVIKRRCVALGVSADVNLA